MDTTTIITITPGRVGRIQALELATAINTHHDSGAFALVNGRQVWCAYAGTQRGQAAQVWQNGTLSINVTGRKLGAQGTVWVKPGDTVTVEWLS
jgi:hypothetical protein